jgi:hypothetical protein
MRAGKLQQQISWGSPRIRKEPPRRGIKLRGGAKFLIERISDARLRAPRPDANTGLAGCNRSMRSGTIAAFAIWSIVSVFKSARRTKLDGLGASRPSARVFFCEPILSSLPMSSTSRLCRRCCVPDNLSSAIVLGDDYTNSVGRRCWRDALSYPPIAPPVT